MYEITNKSKKTVKNIVDNLNDVVETSKGKGKMHKYGKASVKMPEVDSDIGEKLGEYAEKQIKTVKASTKKVKANIDLD
jgi:hypothetical protein